MKQNPMFSASLSCQRDYQLKIIYTATALVRLEFSDTTSDQLSSHLPTFPWFLPLLADKMSAYFQGKQVDFDQIPLTFNNASLFQQRVWQTVKCVPYGNTASYKDIANRLGAPRASRAVGRALATNPILIIIPCHRILTSDGKIGGYRAGTAYKEKLLAMERHCAHELERTRESAIATLQQSTHG